MSVPAGNVETRLMSLSGTNASSLASVFHGLELTQNSRTMNLAHDNVLRCEAGENLNVGDVVFLSGQTTLPLVLRSSLLDTIQPFGVVTHTVSSGSPVNILMSGVLTYNTTGWTAGSKVYMTSSGTLTITSPLTSELVKVQVGTTLTVGTSGSILVRVQQTVGNDSYGSLSLENLEYNAAGWVYANTTWQPTANYSPASTTLSANVAAGATTVTVTSSTGMVVGDNLSFDFEENRQISNIVGNEITLTIPLEFTHSSGTVVYRIGRHHFHLSNIPSGKYLFLFNMTYSLTQNASTYDFQIVWRNQNNVESVIHTYNSINGTATASEAALTILYLGEGSHVIRAQFATGAVNRLFTVYRLNMYIVRLS